MRLATCKPRIRTEGKCKSNINDFLVADELGAKKMKPNLRKLGNTRRERIDRAETR